MRKPLAFLFVLAAGIFTAALVSAGPGLGITKTEPISGTGSSGDTLKLTLCAADEVYQMNAGGTAFECSAAGGGVVAGTNIDVSGSTVSVEPSVTLAGEANTDTLDVNNSALLNDPGTIKGVDTNLTGTWDPAGGAGPFTSYGGYFNNAMTGDVEDGGKTHYGVYAAASGGNWGYGIYATATAASGAQMYAAYFDAGNVQANGDVGLGNATTDAVTIAGDLTVADTVALNGASITFGDAVTDLVVVTGDLTVGDTVNLVGSSINFGNAATDLVTVTGDLTVTDAVQFDGAVDIDGNVTLGDAATDLVTVTGDLNVSDDTTLTDSLIVNGNVTLGNAATDTVTVTGDLTVSDDTTMTAGTTTVGDFRGTVQTVSTTGTINDLSLDATTTVVRFTGASTVVLQGLTGGSEGRVVRLENASGGNLIIVPSAGGSTAANQFLTSAGLNNYIDSHDTIAYDGSSSRWRSGGVYQMSAANVIGAVVAGTTLSVGSTATLGDSNDDVTAVRMLKDSSSAPTLSSCGTSPTATGGSNGFVITVGTGSTTTCTATFATTKTNSPACVVATESNTLDLYISAISATAITVSNQSGANMASTKIHVVCMGDA
jgi:predicted acyltransferase (DUF342 family)